MNTRADRLGGAVCAVFGVRARRAHAYRIECTQSDGAARWRE
jgi:predicted secreted protein